MSDGYAPCPACKQYSHSIGNDRITAAFNHLQSMTAMPVQNAFDEQTRDAAQVLMAENERLKAALQQICIESNSDWSKVRDEPREQIDVIHGIATDAFFYKHAIAQKEPPQ